MWQPSGCEEEERLMPSMLKKLAMTTVPLAALLVLPGTSRAEDKKEKKEGPIFVEPEKVPCCEIKKSGDTPHEPVKPPAEPKKEDNKKK
jgi:hypothetical protein